MDDPDTVPAKRGGRLLETYVVVAIGEWEQRRSITRDLATLFGAEPADAMPPTARARQDDLDRKKAARLDDWLEANMYGPLDDSTHRKAYTVDDLKAMYGAK